MCTREYWRTASRPASFDPGIAIHERKPVHAETEEEAERLVEAMPPVMIGGTAYRPSLIKNFSPSAVH